MPAYRLTAPRQFGDMPKGYTLVPLSLSRRRDLKEQWVTPKPTNR